MDKRPLVKGGDQRRLTSNYIPARLGTKKAWTEARAAKTSGGERSGLHSRSNGAQRSYIMRQRQH